MKVMSAPSFTSRPIHQSLLYFCRHRDKMDISQVQMKLLSMLFQQYGSSGECGYIVTGTGTGIVSDIVTGIVDDDADGAPLTSFICRKSLVSKLIAAPWTGQSPSRAPQ
jgi:hypothetical protein